MAMVDYSRFEVKDEEDEGPCWTMLRFLLFPKHGGSMCSTQNHISIFDASLFCEQYETSNEVALNKLTHTVDSSKNPAPAIYETL